jgi:hypothetical protein
LTEARCPVCGRTYDIPEGTGRAMVETNFLRHKDRCRVPKVGELVRARGSVVVVEGVDRAPGGYPVLTVRYASGRESVLSVAQVQRIRDQGAAKARFFG